MKQKKSVNTICGVFEISALFIGMAHAGGGTVVVNSFSDVPEPGLTTLREAIEEVNSLPDLSLDIQFDETVFSQPRTIKLESGEMVVTVSTNIIGPGADLLTIDASDLSRVMSVDDGENNTQNPVEISGITFTNGNSDSVGGCIRSRENLTIKSSVFKNCTANNRGGGVFTLRNGNLIEDSLFIGNTATNGGGLSHQAGDGNNMIKGSTFVGNTATQRGGGLHIFQTDNFEIINSTFSNNTSDDGAGLKLDSTASIVNVTIVNNSGTGISSSENNIQNSIIANNTAADCVFIETPFNVQNNLDSDGTCEINATSHITVSNPMLEPLAFFGGPTPTHRPLPGSPVIDAGNDDTCTTEDQRGIARPQDGDDDLEAICDIGAVEYTLSESILQELIFKDGFDLTE